MLKLQCLHLIHQLIQTTSEVEYQRVKYTNPLRTLKQDGTPYFVPIADPDIIRGDDGYFYMYPTNAEVEKGDRGMHLTLVQYLEVKI